MLNGCTTFIISIIKINVKRHCLYCFVLSCSASESNNKQLSWHLTNVESSHRFYKVTSSDHIAFVFNRCDLKRLKNSYFPIVNKRLVLFILRSNPFASLLPVKLNICYFIAVNPWCMTPIHKPLQNNNKNRKKNMTEYYMSSSMRWWMEFA